MATNVAGRVIPYGRSVDFIRIKEVNKLGYKNQAKKERCLELLELHSVAASLELCEDSGFLLARGCEIISSLGTSPEGEIFQFYVLHRGAFNS